MSLTAEQFVEGGDAAVAVGRVVDLVIIGAGPAGMAAAHVASERGLNVVLIDAGGRVGGQYWRHPVNGPESARDLLHDIDDLQAGLAAIARGVRRGRLEQLTGHQVWTVTHDVDGHFSVYCLYRDGTAPNAEKQRLVNARTVLVATGAYDRQLPFNGWDLPGVMTAGAAQALLKEHGVPAGRRVVVAGTGPFLLPVAVGLIRRGVTVSEVVEANSPSHLAAHVGAVAASVAAHPGVIGQATEYARELAKARVRIRTRSVVEAAHADRQGNLTAVTIAPLKSGGGDRRRVECDALAVGWGFTPVIELALACGADTAVDLDGSLVVTVDGRLRTSVDGLYAAGEVTGVGGAALAGVEGTLAALAVVRDLTGRDDPALLRRLDRRRSRLRRFAGALAQTYPVPVARLRELSDDVVVCRCEEVTAGQIRASVSDLGATAPRTAKLLSRAGMGRCQGRVCGFATACLVRQQVGQEVRHDVLDEASHAAASAGATGGGAQTLTAADLRGLADRPIAAPIPLGLLAQEL